MPAAPTAPRLLRFRDAPAYLGMDKNRFNREVRPCVAAIRIGVQGIAFDRLDLDNWADEYKSRNGRPAAVRSRPWDNEERPVSPSVARIWHVDKWIKGYGRLCESCGTGNLDEATRFLNRRLEKLRE